MLGGEGDWSFVIGVILYSIGPVGLIGFPLAIIFGTIVFYFVFREPRKKTTSNRLNKASLDNSIQEP